MTSKIWESPYHLFKNGTGKQFYKKNYTRKMAGKIQLSYDMTKAISKVIQNKKYYSEWELDFCKSILANNSYTEKQFPYLVRIFKNNKYRFVDNYKTI